MPGRSRISRLAAFILLACFFFGCAINPATQRKELIFINTANEVALGRDMDEQIRRQLKVVNDPVLLSRLESIGRKIAYASDRQDLEYKFRVVEDKELNAFAVPGGFLFVNTGLLEKANDDELACVLGHEVGHIAARHSVKRIQADLGYQIIMSIVLGGSDSAQNVSRAVDVVFNLASLGYSREDELLADKLSVKYSKKAGYNPYGMVTFFRKLKDASRGSVPVFLSSHPRIDERIASVEQEIAQTK